MLVLTRREGEEIMIGDDIVVRVAEIRGDRIRIGVTAPKNIPIHRAELREDQHDGVPADTTSEPRQFMKGGRE